MESDKRKILTAKDLSKTFSNGSVQQHVLKNLNLSIYKGDFTVIMGNSGSGKTKDAKCPFGGRCHGAHLMLRGKDTGKSIDMRSELIDGLTKPQKTR